MDENFVEHLGDARYYDAYLNHFSEYLFDHTPNEAFERFILSSSSNFDPDLAANDVSDIKKTADEGKKHPEMLNRALAGLLHPFIHLSYGFEFGLPGQVAEGLLFFGSNIFDPILEGTRSCMDRRPQRGTNRAGATFVLYQTCRTRYPGGSDV
jgi:hypothetical protein